MLIILKSHKKSFDELSGDEIDGFFDLVDDGKNLFEEGFNIEELDIKLDSDKINKKNSHFYARISPSQNMESVKKAFIS